MLHIIPRCPCWDWSQILGYSHEGNTHWDIFIVSVWCLSSLDWWKHCVFPQYTCRALYKLDILPAVSWHCKRDPQAYVLQENYSECRASKKIMLIHLICIKVAIFNNADPSHLLNGCYILSEKYHMAELALIISILSCICSPWASAAMSVQIWGAGGERTYVQRWFSKFRFI